MTNRKIQAGDLVDISSTTFTLQTYVIKEIDDINGHIYIFHHSEPNKEIQLDIDELGNISVNGSNEKFNINFIITSLLGIFFDDKIYGHYILYACGFLCRSERGHNNFE